MLVVVVVFTPVATLVISTDEPGMEAPIWSTTVPTKFPSVAWAFDFGTPVSARRIIAAESNVSLAAFDNVLIFVASMGLNTSGYPAGGPNGFSDVDGLVNKRVWSGKPAWRYPAGRVNCTTTKVCVTSIVLSASKWANLPITERLPLVYPRLVPRTTV